MTCICLCSCYSEAGLLEKLFLACMNHLKPSQLDFPIGLICRLVHADAIFVDQFVAVANSGNVCILCRPCSTRLTCRCLSFTVVPCQNTFTITTCILVFFCLIYSRIVLLAELYNSDSFLLSHVLFVCHQ